MDEDTIESVDDSIEQAVTEPQQYSGDGETVTSRPLSELLKTRDAIAARAAVSGRRSGWAGAVFARGRTPGAGAH